MVLVVNRSHKHELFSTGDLLRTGVPPLSAIIEGTDHRGLYLLTTRYYSKLAAGG
jgi:hypothetical protein